MKIQPFSLAAAVALAACGTMYKPVSLEAPSAKLTRQASFYVMLPADGQYASRMYAQSGAMTAHAAVTALSGHVDKVMEASSVEQLDAALVKARQANVTHVLQPVILRWEDRATEWSGVSDKLSIKLTVYEAQTGKLVSSSVIDANSSFWTFGGDHPQDLLPAPTQRFVDQLF